MKRSKLILLAVLLIRLVVIAGCGGKVITCTKEDKAIVGHCVAFNGHNALGDPCSVEKHDSTCAKYDNDYCGCIGLDAPPAANGCCTFYAERDCNVCCPKACNEACNAYMGLDKGGTGSGSWSWETRRSGKCECECTCNNLEGFLSTSTTAEC